MTIDWSLRFGDIVSVLGSIVIVTSFLIALRGKIDLLSQKVTTLETTATNQSAKIDKLGEMLITMGRYEERLASQGAIIATMKQEIEGLRNGQGYINGPRLANAAIP